MDNQQYFNLVKNTEGAAKVLLSSEGSWNLNTDSETSLGTSQAANVPEVPQSVQAATETFTIHHEPINARVIFPAVTDEQTTEDKPSYGQVFAEESCSVVGSSYCYRQLVRSSQTLTSFDYAYGNDVCTEPESSDSVGGEYTRQVATKEDLASQIVNLPQIRADNPGGDSKPKGSRGCAAAKAKNFERGDAENRGLMTDRHKHKKSKSKKSFRNKNKQIMNVYMCQANKVSTKPAPFLQRSSSYINRQAAQRETDRNNYMMVKKLINVKAAVSTFR